MEHTNCNDQRQSGAWEGRTYQCELEPGHEGEHFDGRYAATWAEGAQTVLDPYAIEASERAAFSAKVGDGTWGLA